MFDWKLRGTQALITGASSGLGRHFAEVLAGQGVNLVLAARRIDRLEVAGAALAGRYGIKATAVEWDVADPTAADKAMAHIEAEAGTCGILVNNAGVGGLPRSPLKLTDGEWQSVMEVNLNGAWRVARAFAGHCVAHGQPGTIVNIGSVYGIRVPRGNIAYAVSKAALLQMTKALAIDLLRHGIRVNALCPGFFESEMTTGETASEAMEAYLRGTPSGRMGRLEELDGPLLLLASGASSFMTGAVVPVDGGHSIQAI